MPLANVVSARPVVVVVVRTEMERYADRCCCPTLTVVMERMLTLLLSLIGGRRGGGGGERERDGVDVVVVTQWWPTARYIQTYSFERKSRQRHSFDRR